MARIPSLLADAPTGLCPGLCTSDATFSAPKAYTALQRRINWSHRTGSEGTGGGLRQSLRAARNAGAQSAG